MGTDQSPDRSARFRFTGDDYPDCRDYAVLPRQHGACAESVDQIRTHVRTGCSDAQRTQRLRPDVENLVLDREHGDHAGRLHALCRVPAGRSQGQKGDQKDRR